MSNNQRTKMPSAINKEIQEDMRKLVMARIKAASSDLRVSIGSTAYTKEELLKRIEANDDIGKEIVNIQIEYLRDMATGAIYKDE